MSTGNLEEVLKEIVADIRYNLDATGTNASGRTSDSLRVEMREDGGSVTGRRYFQGVEIGRPGGRVPQNFRAIIRQWMRDKGISAVPIPYKRQPSENWQPKYTPEERGAMAMAGAIAEKIRREGTRLFREGGRTDIYSNVLAARMRELEAAAMGGVIETINDNRLI